MNDELLKSVDLQEISSKGSRIYEEIKSQYEPENLGKFLAIDIDSRDAYLGDTSADAVVSARASHPKKVFYVKKIGFDAAETLASLTRHD
jgi:hypothetical protein